VGVAIPTDLVYDPYDRASVRNPYPMFRRLRDEAPLYWNEEHAFFAVSRFEDVERAHVDRSTYISSRGVTLGMLKSGFEIPPGTVIFEDPPTHTIHRKLLSRMFTPRSIAELEPQIRQLCGEFMDPLAGAGGFDWIGDFGRDIPSMVIGMLIGIPESDMAAIRQHFERGREAEGQEYGGASLDGAIFSDYIDWRIEHPSDDIMTQLLYAEFEGVDGETRKLTREELLAYVNLIAAAGNDTTRLLIGWTGRLLSDHPDQTRLLVEDPTRITAAIEEILRFESPPLQSCRYVARDVEVHGQVVPEGSIMALLLASANHDERQWEDPERFDVLRTPSQHFSFGFGAHYCLGQALARLQGRVVLEEVLRRWPEWELREDGCEFLQMDADLRGWAALPCTVG
jgi:cytochrome P450